MPVIWFQNLYSAQTGCLSPAPSKTKNHNAELIEGVILCEEISILHSLYKCLFGVSSFVFSPVLSLRQVSGSWEGMQLFTEIFACQTTLPRQCQRWHESTSWQDCQQSHCAGEQVSFWCHFFQRLALFLLMQQNFCQTPATAWHSLVSSLLQRLCSHQCGWTGRGLT